MASIESVNSARSSALSQYQEYLSRIRDAKAAQDASTDKANPAQLEKANPQNDQDHDGD